MSTTVSVIGSTGRMGQLAIKLIEESEDLSVHSQLSSSSKLEECLGADVILDLSKPDVSESVADFVMANNLRAVIGTSGWSKEKLDGLRKKMAGSSATIAVVPNFSIGSVLSTKFAAEASKYFDSVEIIETHHTSKLDAPSGTALFTSQEISSAREEKPSSTNSLDAPLFSGIPILSKRIDGAHAEQEVFLRNPEESIYLKHVVTSHEVYSAGLMISLRKISSVSGLQVGLLSLLESN